jgi:hypothetical protein
MEMEKIIVSIYARYCSRSECEVYFRHDPIPGINRRVHGWFRTTHKVMKTTQERRMSCDYDHKEYTRGRRNKANLSNSWDDIQKTLQRSWKQFRKTQYRKTINM